ncbi:unnamed protein product [Urochloa decumbens]|uniref:Uncharacterized protein n=1 Tax=Urochloa decumbens TaxID=240449 RepID=A0ABC8VZ76_9POAL
MHGEVNQGNPNVNQNWQHDLAGAAQAVQEDAGINNEQMQDIQHELADNVNVPADDWPQWQPMNQEDDNMDWDNNQANVAQQQQQQESITFDQSGSTAEYLRAHGPDIVLNIEDILKGSAMPRALHLPICVDKVSLTSGHIQSANCQASSNPNLAIVPFMPSLHAVLITIWANSQNRDPEVLEQQHVALPEPVSLDNEDTPLVASAVRSSTRLNKDKEGFKDVQHIELEDNRRKKRRVWREVTITPKEAALLLDNPPKPIDDEYPGEILAETLKGWGIDCNVASEKLTEEALNAEVRNDMATE